MGKTFIVETSARHVHVTAEDLEILFGKGATLTNKKDLSQPGQFACEERVNVVGPKGELKNVSILGPVRPATQIEVSATDARALGVTAFIRESGDIAGTAGCKLVGPCGEVELSEGVIVAKRHIHMTPADAEAFQVKDKDIVWVKVPRRNAPSSLAMSLFVSVRNLLLQCILTPMSQMPQTRLKMTAAKLLQSINQIKKLRRRNIQR